MRQGVQQSLSTFEVRYSCTIVIRSGQLACQMAYTDETNVGLISRGACTHGGVLRRIIIIIASWLRILPAQLHAPPLDSACFGSKTITHH